MKIKTLVLSDDEVDMTERPWSFEAYYPRVSYEELARADRVLVLGPKGFKVVKDRYFGIDAQNLLRPWSQLPSWLGAQTDFKASNAG